MINIALCGANGKMCKVIYDIIKNKDDVKVVCGFDIYTQKYADFEIYEKFEEYNKKDKIDVMIDFSVVDQITQRLEYCIENKIPLVIATTGFSKEQIEQINKASVKIPIFFTFNLSLGVNLLEDLAKRAISVLGDEFDIEIVEKHHNQKVDAPSGTAFMLANSINEAANDKYKYMYDRHSIRQKRDKKEIGIHAIRGGTIVGEHEVIFSGRDEIITLSHSARSKEVFAVGAYNAAIFLSTQNSGMYTMKDLLNTIK